MSVLTEKQIKRWCFCSNLYTVFIIQYKHQTVTMLVNQDIVSGCKRASRKSYPCVYWIHYGFITIIWSFEKWLLTFVFRLVTSKTLCLWLHCLFLLHCLYNLASPRLYLCWSWTAQSALSPNLYKPTYMYIAERKPPVAVIVCSMMEQYEYWETLYKIFPLVITELILRSVQALLTILFIYLFIYLFIWVLL
jgi:hypothetical protein